jgi:arylformamidase
VQLIDISIPIRPSMIVYEGDPSVWLERVRDMASGAICNVSRLDCGVHTGTHIDAPVHFIDGGAGIEATPLHALIGPAYVIDATPCERDIDGAMIDALHIPPGTERLLFKTRNSALWDASEFSSDFIGLTASAAAVLIDRGIKLVAMDYLSVAPAADPAPTHIALLTAGVVILEGIDLRAVDPGAYQLICLPLLIPGSDGAPARAILMRD